MRKDISIEKLRNGGGNINKSELSRQYNCCWRTIDRRLNPDKYKKEKKIRIYTSKLDDFKEKLYIKYYIRYQDDGIILNNDKKYLKYCLKMIKNFLLKYGLSLNNKTKIINVSKNGVCFRFHIKNKIILKVRNNTKKRFKRKMKLIKNGKMNNDKNIIASYKGYFKQGNCYNLFYKFISLYFK